MEKKITESPIRTIRIKAGVSQAQMADALEVQRSVIAGLEAGIIRFDEEDVLIESKIGKLFEFLSDWSSIPKKELIKKQTEYTRQNNEKILEKAVEKIQNYITQQMRTPFTEQKSGSENSKGEELDWLIKSLGVACKENCISPVRWFRDKAQMTQRQLALVAGIPQTFVARLELGEVDLPDLDNGSKVLEFLIKALGYSETSDSYYKLYNSIILFQETLIKESARSAKDRVVSSLKKNFSTH